MTERPYRRPVDLGARIDGAGMRRAPRGRTIVLRPGVAPFGVSSAALSCLLLKSIDALGSIAWPLKSDIRARTTVSGSVEHAGVSL